MTKTNPLEINDLSSRIALRYTFPEKCAITRDDLKQEGRLAILEYLHQNKIERKDLTEREEYAIARKAMQQAFHRYTSPVTRSTDSKKHSGEDGSKDIVLEDAICDTDTPNPEERMIQAEEERHLAMKFAQVLATLNPRQLFVYERLIRGNDTASDVATQLGVSLIRVRVMKHEVEKKLQQITKN